VINLVVTSKPVDGLLYYSYEYCSYLNSSGIDAAVIIICHKDFTTDDYIRAVSNKYVHCENIKFDNITPQPNDITLIMGRSMMTLSWQNFYDYDVHQQNSLRRLFGNRVISVYSENHPAQYPLAVKFYNPHSIIDLCDKEVYPQGEGDHFEKTINFHIHKPLKADTEPQFEYLFLGTNKNYYKSVEKIIDRFPNHGILTYDLDYVNIKNNNIFVPVDNLMNMFNTYVYTKEVFDPAPRIFQECKYYGKNVIYFRDSSFRDGGSVYWARDIKEPDITPIAKAMKEIE